MAKKNRTAIYNMAIRQFRKLAIDSKGKYKYEEALNKVCFDLFGKKDVATKLGPKSKLSRIQKCISTFDFESLIAILANNSAAHKMQVAVMARNAMNSGKYTGKEFKNIKKSYKKIITSLGNQFNIEKASDDILSELDRLTDGYDDYEYDFDNGDDIFDSIWEDEDGPFTRTSRRYGSSAKHKNELAKLLYGDNDDYDDEDEDDDDDNISKIVDVLENLTDRIDNLESNSYDDYRRPPMPRRRSMNSRNDYYNPPLDDGWELLPREDYYDDEDDGGGGGYEEQPPEPIPKVAPPPTPVEMTTPPPAPSVDLSSLIDAIKENNNNLQSVSNAVAETSRTVKTMQSDLASTMRNVAYIMNDIYEDDAPPETSDTPEYPIRDSDKNA